ncbi:MAG: hypothetical protein LC799_25410 [Actinobacteria bacterium]|nr:hypothetical protein [Actinomycetota bacterium]
MGRRGPVGKRTEEKLGHRSREELERVTKAPAGEAPVIPQPDPSWHSNAAGFYRELQSSGQSAFYEAADWRVAWHTAAMMSHNANHPDAPNAAALFAQVLRGCEALLATEGARRRVRLELQRQGKAEESGGEDSAVAAMESYRAQLRGV